MNDQEILQRARQAAESRGFSIDYAAARRSIARVGDYWEVDFWIEQTDPASTGGEGFRVRLEYPTGECDDVLGFQ